MCLNAFKLKWGFMTLYIGKVLLFLNISLIIPVSFAANDRLTLPPFSPEPVILVRDIAVAGRAGEHKFNDIMPVQNIQQPRHSIQKKQNRFKSFLIAVQKKMSSIGCCYEVDVIESRARSEKCRQSCLSRNTSAFPSQDKVSISPETSNSSRDELIKADHLNINIFKGLIEIVEEYNRNQDISIINRVSMYHILIKKHLESLLINPIMNKSDLLKSMFHTDFSIRSALKPSLIDICKNNQEKYDIYQEVFLEWIVIIKINYINDEWLYSIGPDFAEKDFREIICKPILIDLDVMRSPDVELSDI